MGIMNYFPGDTPREVQTKALVEIEAAWEDYDVFVVGAPTGSGKSAIAVTLVDWRRCGSILTPTNMLVDQYKGDYGALHTLTRRDRYATQNDYEAARHLAANRPTVMNYYVYLSNRVRQPLLVIDEAHNLVPFLTSMKASSINTERLGWDMETIMSQAEVVELVDELDLDTLGSQAQGQIKKLTKVLKGKHKTHLMRQEGTKLKLIPLTARHGSNPLWSGSRMEKIVLMSATINERDIADMGLDRKRVKYIATGSPIPPENRPIVPLNVGNIGHRSAGTEIATWIECAACSFEGKGLVHATYSWAARLRAKLGHNERFLWHTPDNKKEVFQRWEESDQDLILVASGMEEGIDLAYEKARWQIIAKVNFPNLADPAVYEKFRNDREWWYWQAIKNVLQASGRVCRAPNDYGITFILDTAFSRLLDDYEHLFPEWFKEALVDDSQVY